MTLPGTIIGGGLQDTARIACEFSVNVRRGRPTPASHETRMQITPGSGVDVIG